MERKGKRIWVRIADGEMDWEGIMEEDFGENMK